MADDHRGCDIDIQQVWENGRCIGSKVTCETHGIVLKEK